MALVARDLKTALVQSRHQLRNRDGIAYEIHYRMPRRLGRAYQASHFSLIRRSPEDWNFDGCREQLLKTFARSNPTVSEAVFPDYGSAPNDERNQIAASYDTILERETALFVFGAYDRVVDLVARNAVDELGLTANLKAEITRWAKRFRAFAGGVTPPEAPADDDSQLDDLGSSRRWLEKYQRAEPIEWPELEKLFTDFRHIRLKASVDPEIPGCQAALADFDYFLRWSRSPQSWNYTFIESLSKKGEQREDYFTALTNLLCACAMEPSVLSARAFPDFPTDREFPGFLLAGAHYFLVPIDMLLALSVIPPSTLGSEKGTDVSDILMRIRRSKLADKERVAAERFLKAMKDGLIGRQTQVATLLQLCLHTQKKAGTQALLERHWNVTLTSDEQAQKIAMQKRVDELFSQPETAWQHEILKFFRTFTGRKNPMQIRGVYRFMGNLGKETTRDPSIEAELKQKVLRIVADVTTSFWEFAVAPNLSSSRLREEAAAASDGASIGEPGSFVSDFVCSSMIEGRCLYFSNFMPENEDRFTRTLFIDIGMERLQSARMLQRLSDILTYRSMPIRHLERVNAAIEALLELNLRLNSIQGGAIYPSLDAGGRVPDLDDLKRQLADSLDVSRSVARLNGFITYGVTGQWRSADAYLKQILERCEDLREERIDGYAKLTDFVKRRLAHSVRFVERMHGHHRTVVGRVSDLMERTRTELDSYLTERIADALTAQNETVRHLKDTSETLVRTVEELTKVSRKMADNLVTQNTIMSTQTRLLKSAEALILIGSTYYLFSLFGHFGHPTELLEAASSMSRQSLPSLSLLATAVFLTFVLSVLFMRLWPRVDAAIERRTKVLALWWRRRT